MTRRSWIIGAVLVVVVAGAVYMADTRARDSSLSHYAQKFSLLRTLRRSALEAYIATTRAEMTFWSVSESLQEIAPGISNAWKRLPEEEKNSLLETMAVTPQSTGDGQGAEVAEYRNAHAELHRLAEDFISSRGYYDLFLMDPDGNVIYTVIKESDFATNLVTGPYSDTGLADVFKLALEDEDSSVRFSDLERYSPSNDDPAIFAARRMVDAAGQTIGVLALQLPTAKIVEIMQFDAGMGESGETYIVGDDLLMRSDSRFSAESTILRTTVDTETVSLALAGQSGVSFVDDYRGIEVLSAYDSIEIDGFRWAIMAEIDKAEVQRATAGLSVMLMTLGAAVWGLALWSIGFVARLVLPTDNLAADSEGIADLDIG